MDLVLVVPGLILAAPVMLVLAILIFFSDGRPVIFAQKRPGLYGKIFTLYKFRTMHHMVDKHGDTLPDAARLTRLGKFLRSVQPG